MRQSRLKVKLSRTEFTGAARDKTVENSLGGLALGSGEAEKTKRGLQGYLDVQTGVDFQTKKGRSRDRRWNC